MVCWYYICESGWIEKKTIEGQSYYFNTVKEILSWDKPDALKTAEEKRVDEANLCWITDKKEGWSVCFLTRVMVMDDQRDLNKQGSRNQSKSKVKWQRGHLQNCSRPESDSSCS